MRRISRCLRETNQNDTDPDDEPDLRPIGGTVPVVWRVTRLLPWCYRLDGASKTVL